MIVPYASRVWCALVLLAGTAAADSDKPWAADVSEADQARAEEIFARGNVLVEQGLFSPAVKLYGEALAIWNHPRIHYNLAVALINLERDIEASDELAQALGSGATALEPEIYEQALAYQRILRTHIVDLAIECVDRGTRITLDGKAQSVACPGTTHLKIHPGGHRLIAEAPGSLTRTIDLAPAGGESPIAHIDLMTLDEATIHHRRWATWKPWIVVGAGAFVGLVGAGIELQAAATYRSYDRAVATLCPGPAPCDSLPALITDARAEARHQNEAAVTCFVAGGAVIATGAVFLWLNRSIAERIGYDGAPLVTAHVDRDGATLAARIAF